MGTASSSSKSPRDDFIAILCDRVVNAINENIDDECIEEILPTTTPDLPFYDSTLLYQLKYQRDLFLGGIGTYSTERSSQQQHHHQYSSTKMPYTATAFGYVELVKFGSWFVPSTTTKELLLPIVISMPSGILNDTITTTVSNSIPLAQPILDDAVKDAVIGFIDDPEVRELIKSRTQKILRVNDVG